MPIGNVNIPSLRLTTLQKLITRFSLPPEFILMNMFGSSNWESETIEWESQIGSRGMTPFSHEDTGAPKTAPIGIAQHSAMAAFWKEKIYLSATMLNNLRQPGTREQLWRSEAQVATQGQMLRARCDRRKEWMFAQMFSGGTINYKGPDSTQRYVDYGIPTSNQVTLGATRVWDTGTNINIIEDIMDAKIAQANNNGATLDMALLTSEVLKMMVLNPAIQTLLQKSAYGIGDLFARPLEVLGSLLKLQLIEYDQQYQLKSWLTAAVTGASTTVVSVDDVADYEVGGTLRFHDLSAKTYEDETISSIDDANSTITVATAPAASFKTGEDFVTMTKKFLPTNKFIMFTPSIEGQLIAEFANAPFGLERNYGLTVDTELKKDPDGLYVRVQNKGLPVLYQEDGIYILTVT